jgi:hypothetical protein
MAMLKVKYVKRGMLTNNEEAKECLRAWGHKTRARTLHIPKQPLLRKLRFFIQSLWIMVGCSSKL